MGRSDKAKEKLDETSKEVKEAVDNLKQEITELTKKVKDRFKGTGQEMRESVEDLTQEVKRLSEKVKELIPKKKKKGQLPVHVDKYPMVQPHDWEQPFVELRKATDRLFDDFFRNFRLPVSEGQTPWGLTPGLFGEEWPRVDISETDEEIQVTAELPGVDKDNMDVSVTDDRITIRGEKRQQGENRGRGYYKLERSYGSFQRSFSLPCEVESERADACFKDGVLLVKLPKSAAARERVKKILVRNGDE
jgi:HSP20 family protein